jgi:hypothetical protein
MKETNMTEFNTAQELAEFITGGFGKYADLTWEETHPLWKLEWELRLQMERDRENWDRHVPRCQKNLAGVERNGDYGGGYTSCLHRLNPDGSCPAEELHHDVWRAKLDALTECGLGIHLASCRH